MNYLYLLCLMIVCSISTNFLNGYKLNLEYGFIRAFTKKTQNSFKRINKIIKAAQQDPANSDSLKAALAVLTESLWHHSTSL